MDNLRMITKPTHFVEYFDLEKYVKERYGHKIEIIAMEECANNGYLSYSVTNEFADAFELKEAEDWKENGHFWYYGTGNILNLLCADGYIPAGKYVIEISW